MAFFIGASEHTNLSTAGGKLIFDLQSTLDQYKSIFSNIPVNPTRYTIFILSIGTP